MQLISVLSSLCNALQSSMTTVTEADRIAENLPALKTGICQVQRIDENVGATLLMYAKKKPHCMNCCLFPAKDKKKFLTSVKLL